ncbi:MAG: 50S ribosomal protein L15 [Magnetovibrio sp.]|nr:50S ribosomal protein L15 [Magnetovibrio sp.]|tara:strand:- start:5547 stop:6098 length:552 start_codon:yes stop_codon:yes gene_type:complete
MRLNEIRDNASATKNRKRVGRGIGSGKGKTAGRGHKGQKSRSGVSMLAFEGGQMPLYRRLPKRGFKNPFSKDFSEINLGKLQVAIDAGKIDSKKDINYAVLQQAGIVSKSKNGLKLLAKGELKTKVIIEVSGVSKAAALAVEKAGGKVVVNIGKEPSREDTQKSNSKKSKAKSTANVEQGVVE